MERFRQVIGLMHVTPYRLPTTCPAQMHSVVDTAPTHLTPVAIADCAHFATTVADNDGTVLAHVPGNSSAALLVELHFIVQPFDYFVQKRQSEGLLTV